MRAHLQTLRSPTFLLLLLFACGFGSGCASPKAKPVVTEDLEVFRSTAVKYLEESSFSEDAGLRMNAIEAFEKVAPEDGLERKCIPINIENAYPGVSFVALLAAGQIRATELTDIIRTQAESPNAHIRMAAIFALHQLGDNSRTGELSQLLLENSDARVRANAALIIGRMERSASAVKLLKTALRREKKTAAKLQILESLAIMGDANAQNRLMFDGWSAVAEQSAVALMMLANARCEDAEDLFWQKLRASDQPEVQLQAARGLARLGHKEVLELAIKRLDFSAPKNVAIGDTPERQIERVRGLAALALEDMADPRALTAMRRAFEIEGQSDYVRVALARAAIRTIDEVRRVAASTGTEERRGRRSQPRSIARTESAD